MGTRAHFSTLIYTAALQSRGARSFNNQLLCEIQQLRLDDLSGRAWSATNYPGGFTSYGSVNRLHKLSPTFAALEQKLALHVQRFSRSLNIDLSRRKLAMTDCWANIMSRGVVHGLHLHPLSTISGTYYVRVPPGAPGLKFEDPRLDRMMAAPPRQAWVTAPARTGQVILFESWLRHEVPASLVRIERVSISFNFSWF